MGQAKQRKLICEDVPYKTILRAYKHWAEYHSIYRGAIYQ